MRIVAVSDVHLDHRRFDSRDSQGRSSAIQSTLNCFNAAVGYAIDTKADAFVSTGDETLNGRPAPEIVELFADAFRRLTAAGIPVIDVVGNHSLYGGIAIGERTFNHRYRDISGVHVIDGAGVVRLPSGLQIAGIAWPRRGEHGGNDNVASTWVVEQLDQLATEIGDGPAILAGHLAIADARIHRGSEQTIRSVFREPMIDVAHLEFGPWSHVVLGHIHLRQAIGTKTHYVGSIDRIDFAEAGDAKGWSDINTDTGIVTFHESPARPLVILDGSQPIGDLPEGAVVKVICPPGERLPSKEIRTAIADAGGIVASTVAHTGPHQPQLDHAGKPTTVEAPTLPENVSAMDGLTVWLATQTFAPATRDRLMDAARKLAEEATHA